MNKNNMNKRFLLYGILALALVGLLFWYRSVKNSQNQDQEQAEQMQNVEDNGNAAEMADQIVVDSPKPGTMVESPITVIGKARGVWFFEASFPAKVLDESGNILGQTPIQAKGEWMTEDFVQFNSKVPFSKTESETGTLVLQKDNPSGLPENDAELRIPIRFK